MSEAQRNLRTARIRLADTARAFAVSLAETLRAFTPVISGPVFLDGFSSLQNLSAQQIFRKLRKGCSEFEQEELTLRLLRRIYYEKLRETLYLIKKCPEFTTADTVMAQAYVLNVLSGSVEAPPIFRKQVQELQAIVHGAKTIMKSGSITSFDAWGRLGMVANTPVYVYQAFMNLGCD